MGRLFGTDGARGIANSELSCELAMEIGRATSAVLTDLRHRKPKFLIGRDTRISGQMLENAICAGLCSVGADVTRLGVVSTPAVAYLVKEYGFDAAFMISASHNPCEYNGIKIFNSDGYKLPDAIEDEIEAVILDKIRRPSLKTGENIGRIYDNDNAVDAYREHLIKTTDTDFKGLKIALDCANGSACVTAEKLFKALGCECSIISDSPDGVNINLDCGSTHIERLQKYVTENHLDAGFAFDGDADRVLAVDENGDVVDGDKIIAVCASQLKKEGRLKNSTVVVTVMTNMGFYKFCEQNGISYKVSSVGDRYVLESMLENDYSLGGEQSGHVIFLDYATTGDGQLTAIQILRIMKKTGMTLSALSSCMKTYPQVLVNIRVSDMGKESFADDREIKKAIETAQKELSDNGRVLVRVSGTEPLVRVMLEGRDSEQIERLSQEIAHVIKKRLI